MKKTSPEIHELKKQIEQNLKRKMRTPNDFIFLSGAIWERTNNVMSPTTLKRLWGYLDGADETRYSTLTILSKFLGYNDWDEFINQLSTKEGSDPILSPHVNSKDLQIGDYVFVSWEPNRRCSFRYLGNDKFIVETAANSKLKEGDTFLCSLFILGEPLYLTELIQGKNPPVAFVVGNKGGLCELRKVAKNV